MTAIEFAINNRMCPRKVNAVVWMLSNNAGVLTVERATGVPRSIVRQVWCEVITKRKVNRIRSTRWHYETEQDIMDSIDLKPYERYTYDQLGPQEREIFDQKNNEK